MGNTIEIGLLPSTGSRQTLELAVNRTVLSICLLRGSFCKEVLKVEMLSGIVINFKNWFWYPLKTIVLIFFHLQLSGRMNYIIINIVNEPVSVLEVLSRTGSRALPKRFCYFIKEFLHIIN